MKNVRLHDHNIQGARGIAVHFRRFHGTVKLEIRGTIGQMTVNARELVDAVTTVMSTAGSATTPAPTKPSGQSSPKRSRSGQQLAARSKGGRGLRLSSPGNKSASGPTPKVTMTTVESASETSSFRGTESRRWTVREDGVVRVLSPKMAAEKLRRTMEEVQLRRKVLGLRSL